MIRAGTLLIPLDNATPTHHTRAHRQHLTPPTSRPHAHVRVQLDVRQPAVLRNRRRTAAPLRTQQAAAAASSNFMEPPARGGRSKAAAAAAAAAIGLDVADGISHQSTCFVKKLYTMVATEDTRILSFSHGA
jgi:hypothetical protein